MRAYPVKKKAVRKKAVGPKRGRGAPSHQPDDDSRSLVQTLYIGGWEQPRIARVIGIDEKTLRKHYRNQLDLGKARTDAMVTQSIVLMAIGGPGKGDWTKASPSMASFYAKTRMGWKDPKLDVALSGAVGHYDLSGLTDEEVERVTEILERTALNRADRGLEGGEG